MQIAHIVTGSNFSSKQDEMGRIDKQVETTSVKKCRLCLHISLLLCSRIQRSTIETKLFKRCFSNPS